MNEFIEKILNIKDGTTLSLEKDKVYHVYDDDCIFLEGYYCSNTATKQENPNGFRKTALWLENKNNVTIDGKGATLLIHGIMTPIVLKNCRNITIKNLCIDYFRPTMSEFSVVQNENGICTLSINPESTFEIQDNVLVWCGEKKADGAFRWQNTYKNAHTLSMYFDPKTNCLQFLQKEEGDVFPSVPEFASLERIGNNLLKATLKNKNAFLPEGCVIQSRSVVRDQIGGFFERCRDLTFDNLRVMFFHGLGMLAQYCKNIVYQNCDFTPKQGRTFSSNADFLHFSGCSGKITVRGCRAYGGHDDFINIHGTHLKVVQADGEKKNITVRFANACSWGFQAFSRRDTVEFVQWDNLIPYFKTKVLRFERLNDTDIKLYLKKLPQSLQLDKDCVANLTQTPSVCIKNNYFGYSAARGVLCTTPKKTVIAENSFEDLAGPALLVEDDCNFWYESGYTKKILFKNNKVNRCGFAENASENLDIAVTPQVMDKTSKSFVHGTLKISGNIFSTVPGKRHLLKFYHIRTVRLKDNIFDAEYIVKTSPQEDRQKLA